MQALININGRHKAVDFNEENAKNLYPDNFAHSYAPHNPELHSVAEFFFGWNVFISLHPMNYAEHWAKFYNKEITQKKLNKLLNQ